MNTRSSSVRSITARSPFVLVTMLVATFFALVLSGLRLKCACWMRWMVSCPVPVVARTGPMPPPIAKRMSSTFVLKWNCTPAFSRYVTMGRIIDSYWLYRVKRSAEKSGRPAM